MKKLTALILALAAGLWGCAAPDPRPVAEDCVCLYKGDLGCVRIRVDEQTPKADWQGKTYYFCNDGCRVEFQKEPAKFAAALGR